MQDHFLEQFIYVVFRVVDKVTDGEEFRCEICHQYPIFGNW